MGRVRGERKASTASDSGRSEALASQRHEPRGTPLRGDLGVPDSGSAFAGLMVGTFVVPDAPSELLTSREGFCLEPRDLMLAKLAAGREQPRLDGATQIHSLIERALRLAACPTQFLQARTHWRRGVHVV